MSNIEKENLDNLIKDYNKKMDNILRKIGSIVNNKHIVFCRNCGESFMQQDRETLCNNCKQN